jgi:hypothetical protein
MKVTNQEKMNLTVEVFDFLHVAVSRVLEVHGEIDHDEHGALLTEVINNLYQFVNRHEEVN